MADPFSGWYWLGSPAWGIGPGVSFSVAFESERLVSEILEGRDWEMFDSFDGKGLESEKLEGRDGGMSDSLIEGSAVPAGFWGYKVSGAVLLRGSVEIAWSV